MFTLKCADIHVHVGELAEFPQRKVALFCNYAPMRKALSADRWQLYYLH
jgi:hypothetical protein